MSLKIIGIDPGSLKTGVVVLESSGSNLKLLNHQLIDCRKIESLESRLVAIADGLNEIITQFQPDQAALEAVFMAKNARSALILGHARGVILYMLAKNNIKTFEYSANLAKKSVAGYGHADKVQINTMIKILLKITTTIVEDVSDAAALAICHSNHIKFNYDQQSKG